jgi:hypothetical protein
MCDWNSICFLTSYGLWEHIILNRHELEDHLYMYICLFQEPLCVEVELWWFWRNEYEAQEMKMQWFHTHTHTHTHTHIFLINWFKGWTKSLRDRKRSLNTHFKHCTILRTTLSALPTKASILCLDSL